MGALFQALVQAVGATDHERGILAFRLPAAQPLGQSVRRDQIAALVERDPLSIPWQACLNAISLRSQDLGGHSSSCALLGLYFDQFDARLPRHATDVVRETLAHPGRHAIANCDNGELHGKLLSYRPAPSHARTELVASKLMLTGRGVRRDADCSRIPVPCDRAGAPPTILPGYSTGAPPVA